MKISFVTFLALVFCSLTKTPADTFDTISNSFEMDFVVVGNAGNPADTTGLGNVPYRYRIAKYEVTNSQYVHFLNSVDPNGNNGLSLYNSRMSSDAVGGIDLNTSAPTGSKYRTKTGRANNPVIYVSWYDAIRFTNWLHNLQNGSNYTDNGAYTLTSNGGVIPSNANSIFRNSDALYWIPSEDEWYKSAYHKNDGVTSNYWDYPTSTDTDPVSDQPPGTSAPDQTNVANYYFYDGNTNGYNDGFAVTGSYLSEARNYLSNVGAYHDVTGPFGTYDQAGNVSEWTETLVPGGVRRVSGGGWRSVGVASLRASARGNAYSAMISDQRGFRVASVFVPEPSTLLLGIGLILGFYTCGRP